MLTRLEVFFVVVIVALVVVIAGFVGYIAPHEKIVVQENIIVPTTTPTMAVSPTSTIVVTVVPTYSVGRRILNPIPTPVPTPEPVVNYAGSDKNIMDVPFDDMSGELSLDVIAYQVGKKNWSTVTVVQHIKGYVWNRNERVDLIDGSFEQMIYSQKGEIYYLDNVSISSGTRAFFSNKNMKWYASFLVKQGNKKGEIVYGLKDADAVVAGYGFDIKTRPYSMGGDGASPSSGGDSGNSGSDGAMDVAIQ